MKQIKMHIYVWEKAGVGRDLTLPTQKVFTYLAIFSFCSLSDINMTGHISCQRRFDAAGERLGVES